MTLRLPSVRMEERESHFIYIHYIIYIYFSQQNYIIKAKVKATCFNLKSHRQAKLRTMKFFTVWLSTFGIPDSSQCGCVRMTELYNVAVRISDPR